MAEIQPAVSFDDETGWCAVNGFLSPSEVDAVRNDCNRLLALPEDQRAAGDKPASGTQHLRDIDQRSTAVAQLMQRADLMSVIDQVLGDNYAPDLVEYRCPQPGHGGQRLHTDDIPLAAIGPANVATAIITLCDFAESNGATRVVPGSHKRLDLQRNAGSLDHHPDQIFLTGSAGTAFVFNGHVLHSGTPNQSQQGRPALHMSWRCG